MQEPGDGNTEQPSPQYEYALKLWRAYLTGDNSHLDSKVVIMRRIFRTLPSDPRCKICNAPFKGPGGALVRIFGYGNNRSSFNRKLCGRCETVVKKQQVGLELELTMLFADVRGSTTLAEEIGPSAFHHLINRYYQVCTEVLSNSDALINRLIGDALIGLYVPGIAGPDHGRVAMDAALELLRATGHADPGGPWIGVGIGVHTGTAYLGAVGTADSMSDITVLGDAANTAARLSSAGLRGEVLVSEETSLAAGLNLEDRELRTLHLKGRTKPADVRVLRL
ncbi:MAG: adenylate/guanylate cyclase domain-containing protein [Chloroflexia bacterium]